MSSTIISRVFQDCYCQLEGSLYSGQLVGHLYREKCINLEDKQQIEAESTQFAKSRKLIDILSSKKADSALDHILAHLHNDGTQSHLERIIYESALGFGYGDTNTDTTTRKKVRILGKTWWPEHKEMIKSFVDRSTANGNSLVEHLRKQLLNSQLKATAITSGKQTIVGMGGIGKTSTAKWYGNVYQDAYDHVIWIDSEGASLCNSMERLGRKLGMKRASNVSLEEFVKGIYEQLEAIRCLFIFDNAERLDGTNGLRDLLPKNELHHSLITSRNHDWGHPTEFGQILTFEMSVFTPAECITLLTNALELTGKAGTKEQMLALGEELGFLPLALQCAIATIVKSRTYNLTSYTARVRQDLRILVDKRILSEYERPIRATLQLSIEQIEKEEEVDEDCREACKTILAVAAYWNPTDIPSGLFLAVVNANSHVFSDAVEVLVQYSLVSVVRKKQNKYCTFGMHRILQYVIKHKLLVDSDRAMRAIEQVCGWMDTDFPYRIAVSPDAQIDEAQLSCNGLPLVVPGRRNTSAPAEEFLENAIVSFERLFKATDLPTVRLQLRLVDRIVLDNPGEAKRIIEKMLNALNAEDSGIAVPHKAQLSLHLRISAFEVRRTLITNQKKYERNTQADEELLDYETLVEEVRTTGYNGWIANERLHYPSNHRRSDLTMCNYMEVCHAIRLHDAKKASEATDLMSKLLSTNSDEINIEGLLSTCEMLKKTPNLLHSLFQITYQKLRQLVVSAKQDWHGCRWPAVAQEITEKYTRWLWTVRPKPLSHLLGVLEFLLEVDWNQRWGSRNELWINFFLLQIGRLTALEEREPFFVSRFDEILSKAWDKLDAVVKEGCGDREQQLTDLVVLTNIYTTMLEHSGTLFIIVELDSGTLARLKQPDIDLSRSHLLADKPWHPVPIVTRISTVTVCSGTRLSRILESKLGILLYILRQSASNKFYEDEVRSVMDAYDSGSCALVQLDRMDEAEALWRESEKYILNQKFSNITLSARIGKQTLKLLEDGRQEESLRVFMKTVEKCAERSAEGFRFIIDDIDGDDAFNEWKDIVTLILRLMTCKLFTTAFKVMAGLKQRTLNGAHTSLLQIQINSPSDAALQKAAETAKVRLLQIPSPSDLGPAGVCEPDR